MTSNTLNSKQTGAFRTRRPSPAAEAGLSLRWTRNGGRLECHWSAPRAQDRSER